MSDKNENLVPDVNVSMVPSSRTKFGLIHQKTMEVLEGLSDDELRIPSIVETELLEQCNLMLEAENINRDSHKWRYLDELLPSQIADAIMMAYPIVRVAGTDELRDGATDLIAIYQEDGPDKGIYSSDETLLRNLIRQYSYKMTTKDVNEVISILQDTLPRKEVCIQPNLLAVNNGIFDYDTKELLDFNPDFVFLSKSKVNYNDKATNVVIHNPADGTDWDVESWMDDLTDDSEITNLLWQILGAIVRPNVSWNKSAWFYSESGNNGKGTLCELMRQLCGRGSYASISLADFGKDFMLEPLIRATAIIVDENDVGTYIDKAANLKAVITGDTIFINRKFKSPIAYQFKGFMVQCLNEMPRIKDKSDSFFRRQLFVPFTKCFTGRERKYIKNDYLHRPEVLEYVLYKVLNMDYDKLSEPQACKDALDAYKEFNDPIRQFVDEVVQDATWDLLPFTFLYDIYKIWFKQNTPSGSIQGKNTFINDIIQALNNNTDWYCLGSKNQIRTAHYMDKEEPLATTYNLPQWQHFDRKEKYRGILRMSTKKGCIPVTTV